MVSYCFMFQSMCYKWALIMLEKRGKSACSLARKRNRKKKAVCAFYILSSFSKKIDIIYTYNISHYHYFNWKSSASSKPTKIKPPYSLRILCHHLCMCFLNICVTMVDIGCWHAHFCWNDREWNHKNTMFCDCKHIFIFCFQVTQMIFSM